MSDSTSNIHSSHVDQALRLRWPVAILPAARESTRLTDGSRIWAEQVGRDRERHRYANGVTPVTLCRVVVFIHRRAYRCRVSSTDGDARPRKRGSIRRMGPALQVRVTAGKDPVSPPGPVPIALGGRGHRCDDATWCVSLDKIEESFLRPVG